MAVAHTIHVFKCQTCVGTNRAATDGETRQMNATVSTTRLATTTKLVRKEYENNDGQKDDGGGHSQNYVEIARLTKQPIIDADGVYAGLPRVVELDYPA